MSQGAVCVSTLCWLPTVKAYTILGSSPQPGLTYFLQKFLMIFLASSIADIKRVTSIWPLKQLAAKILTVQCPILLIFLPSQGLFLHGSNVYISF